MLKDFFIQYHKMTLEGLKLYTKVYQSDSADECVRYWRIQHINGEQFLNIYQQKPLEENPQVMELIPAQVSIFPNITRQETIEKSITKPKRARKGKK